MLPLSRAEIEGRHPEILENLFDGKPKGVKGAKIGDDLTKLVLLGGFPEAIRRSGERRRQDWAKAYLTSVLTRDLKDIADIDKFTELPRFVRLV